MPADDYDDVFRYYAPKNSYFEVDEDEVAEMGKSPNAPADLTDRPTSSLNASRPRTVAAGYDQSRGVLTVVFRDGTVWNYDGVTPGEWQNFHASISKGRPWINDQLFGVGQPADLTILDADIQAAIYEASRRAQMQFRTKRQYKDPNTGKATVRRIGKTGARAANRSVNKSLGKNTSKGGKNPYKP
jgi:hypothetical protein